MISQDQAKELQRLHREACQARIGAALLFYDGIDDDGTGFRGGPRAAELAFQNYLRALTAQAGEEKGR